MIERLLSRLEVVHRAATAEERAAIDRFRSQVDAEALRREPGGHDLAHGPPHDAEDDAPASTHLYVGSPAEVDGALRVRSWKPGCVPPQAREALSLDLVPGADKLGICELGRVVVRPSLRGKLIFHALVAAARELAAAEQLDLLVCTCRPSLVALYRTLGLRLSGGRVVTGPDGLELPMLAVLSSPKRPPLDPAPFAALFANEDRALVTDPLKVLTELERGLLGSPGIEPVFFRSLEGDALRRLSDQGFVVSVPDGTLVTHEGHAERELFVVLVGSFEVSSGGRLVTLLKTGDLFGEVAFFTQAGLRSATVRAKGPGRLVVLRRRFLDELARREPKAALAVLMNLGSILAQRLERSTRAR